MMKEDYLEWVLSRNPSRKRKPLVAKKRRLVETENAIRKLPNTRNKSFGMVPSALDYGLVPSELFLRNCSFGIGLRSGSFGIVPSEWFLRNCSFGMVPSELDYGLVPSKLFLQNY